MKKAMRCMAALMIAVLILQVNPAAWAAGSEDTAVPEPENYSFSNGVITGLQQDYLNQLTDEQKQKLCLVIPAEIDGVPVTSIGDNSFNNQSRYSGCLFQLDFSQAVNLEKIGKQAFLYCEFTGTLELPEGITEIGNKAFCPNASGKQGFTGTLKIPETLSSLGAAAFSYQSFTRVEFPENCNLTALSSAFRYCKSLSGVVRLPDSVTSIAASAFADTNVETVYLPAGVTVESSTAFPNTSQLKAIVCAKEDYERLCQEVGSRKAKLGYPVTVSFQAEGGEILEPIGRLFNHALNLISDEEGNWVVDPSYKLPEPPKSASGASFNWAFSSDDLLGVNESDLVAGDTLFAVEALGDPILSYSDGIDKEYDGTPSVVSVSAVHPRYQPAESAENGDVVFYYWWYWSTFNGGELDKEASGYDRNVYDVGGVRADYPVNCYVWVQGYIVKGGKTELFYQERHDFGVDLRYGTPKITVIYPEEPFEYGTGQMPEISVTSDSALGNISWDAEQTLQEGGHTYTWTFQPEDVNYHSISGKCYLFASKEPLNSGNVTEKVNELPDLPDDGTLDADAQKAVLDAKLLYESLPEEERTAASDEVGETLNQALEKLPQVTADVQGVECTDRAILFENMTAEQVQQLLMDEDAVYAIRIEAVPAEANAEEKTAIEEAAGGTVLSGVSQQITVSSCLTAAGIVQKTTLETLRDPIRLTFSIPEELQRAPQGMTRSFSVVRVHAGSGGALEAMRLPVVNQDGKTVTVLSDKFSMYALAYEDIPQDSEKSSGGGSSHSGGKNRPEQADNSQRPSSSGAIGTPDETVFRDISGHWAESAIQFVTEKGLFAGTSETDYSPDEPMTRAMFVTVLHRLAGTPTSSALKAFDDVPEYQWYANAVRWGAEKQIVSGIGENQFAPEENVSREQLIAILYRYGLLSGKVTAKASETRMNLKAFRDEGSISEWAKEPMAWAVGAGLISGKGDGQIASQALATRAEVAVILQRYLQSDFM